MLISFIAASTVLRLPCVFAFDDKSVKMNMDTSAQDEILSIDPYYKHAVEAVDSVMEHVLDSSQIFDKCQTHMHRYASEVHRLRFLDAFRKVMTDFISEHRVRCNRQRVDCPQEHDYATVITAVRDQMVMLNPAVAARSEDLSFELAEANSVVRLLDELKAEVKSITGQVEVIRKSEQFSYDDIIFILEDMNLKMTYGKRDWFDLFKTRLTNVAMDETLRSTIVEPVLVQLRNLLNP